MRSLFRLTSPEAVGLVSVSEVLRHNIEEWAVVSVSVSTFGKEQLIRPLITTVFVSHNSH
jgi:hypothetical protein